MPVGPFAASFLEHLREFTALYYSGLPVTLLDPVAIVNVCHPPPPGLHPWAEDGTLKPRRRWVGLGPPFPFLADFQIKIYPRPPPLTRGGGIPHFSSFLHIFILINGLRVIFFGCA